MDQQVLPMSRGKITLRGLMRVYDRWDAHEDAKYAVFMLPSNRNSVKIWTVWQEFGFECEDPTLEFGNEGDAFSNFLHLAATWDGYDDETFRAWSNLKREYFQKGATVGQA